MRVKLLGRIKSMYVDSLGCVRVKRGVSEWFRIDCGVRQDGIMCLWLFNVYMGTVMKEVTIGIRMGLRFMDEGKGL